MDKTVSLICDIPDDLVQFEREVRVKTFLRKGKVVKAHQRTDKRKRKARPALVGGLAAGAMVVGVPVAAFAAMKFRYIKGIDKSARLARVMARKMPVDTLGENIDHVTFAIGGITKKAKEGRLIAQSLKKHLKGHHLIPFENKTFQATAGGFSPFKELLTTSIRLGRNPDSVEVAARAYAYHVKYPAKQINMVGHSAGGMIGKEAANLLEHMGVPKSQIKVVTTGSPNLGFISPRPGDLNIFAPDDPLRFLAHKGTKMSARNQSGLKFREHFVLSYFRSGKHGTKADGIIKQISDHLGTPPKTQKTQDLAKKLSEIDAADGSMKEITDQFRVLFPDLNKAGTKRRLKWKDLSKAQRAKRLSRQTARRRMRPSSNSDWQLISQRRAEARRRAQGNYSVYLNLAEFRKGRGPDRKKRKRRVPIGGIAAIGAPAIAGGIAARRGANRFTREMFGKQGEGLSLKEIESLRKEGTRQYVGEWIDAHRRAKGKPFGAKPVKRAVARTAGWAMRNPVAAGAIAGGTVGAAGYGAYRGARRAWKRRKADKD